MLKPYRKEFEHSYTLGVFPTLELLTARPETVMQVLVHSRGERNEGMSKIREACSGLGVRVETADKAVERLSPKENAYAVGVFRKYKQSLDPEANHIVLVNPSDMGNLGTIARTMLGFGMADLAMVRPAADAFDPRAIRASMGALFHLRFEYFDAFGEYTRRFPHKAFPFMTDGRHALGELGFTQPFALVFGNESSGLPAEYHKLGESVRIAHTARIDSLSLPVAVAIGVYEATK